MNKKIEGSNLQNSMNTGYISGLNKEFRDIELEKKFRDMETERNFWESPQIPLANNTFQEQNDFGKAPDDIERMQTLNYILTNQKLAKEVKMWTTQADLVSFLNKTHSSIKKLKK